MNIADEIDNITAFDSIRSHYDYIVCGAGTSGSVVASRLAADPQIQVLLIEAGGTDRAELVSDPNRWVEALGSELDWNFLARANPRLNNRRLAYGMGKVLGGGSSINASLWSRGHRADWDAMADAAGDPDWNYDAMLNLFRLRIERWTGTPDPRYRGIDGPVHVQPAENISALSNAVLDAAATFGLPRFPNQNGELMQSPQGCSLVDEIIVDGRRRSIFRSYAAAVAHPRNLTVVINCQVARVLFNGRRAIGVQVMHGSDVRQILAGLEVVVSAGAIQTPKLLMQSGLGPADHLLDKGVQIRHDLPAVGGYLHDHVCFNCLWEADKALLPNVPRTENVTLWRSDASLDAPDFYAYAFGVPYCTPENAARLPPPPGSWSFLVGMSPNSRGTIRLTGPSHLDQPDVDANYLGDPSDLVRLRQGLEFVRELGNSAAMKPFGHREVHPGNGSAADRDRFLRDGLSTFWHQSGTARIGRDPADSVVDGQLRVYGVDGLRVADASVLPRVTRGNTMAPCVGIGERAAQFLAATHRHGAGVTPGTGSGAIPQ